MSVSIVIPHFENWTLTHSLLSDLYRHEKGNIDEVVLVNNGGNSDEVRMGQQYWVDTFRLLDTVKVNVINLKENVGFLLAANLGLKDAEGTIKILISNDVRIQGKFVLQTADHILSKGRKLVGQKLYLTNTGWNNFEGRIYQYLEGFFLATGFREWEELNYFDVDYVESDYEDIDISTKAVSLGYQLVPLNLPYLEHLAAQTYGYSDERLKRTEKNREVFRSKWVNE